ncbi:MAG TPA: hypothetical protein VGL53_29100 [Bryobacteraceae bacterium]|jgi:hypothetical protein
MRIAKFRELSGDAAVLSGAPRGQEVFSKLIKAALSEPSSPEAIFLDFTGVEVATASYLRESVLAFRDFVRGRRSMLYPVVANANPVIQEELRELLKFRGDAIMTCTLTAEGEVSESGLLGNLEPKQRITYDLVLKKGETDAGELMRDLGNTEGMQHTTAWNNRLSSLAALGIVVEMTKGRTKRYRPLFAGGPRDGN